MCYSSSLSETHKNMLLFLENTNINEHILHVPFSPDINIFSVKKQHKPTSLLHSDDDPFTTSLWQQQTMIISYVENIYLHDYHRYFSWHAAAILSPSSIPMMRRKESGGKKRNFHKNHELT